MRSSPTQDTVITVSPANLTDFSPAVKYGVIPLYLGTEKYLDNNKLVNAKNKM